MNFVVNGAGLVANRTEQEIAMHIAAGACLRRVLVGFLEGKAQG